jgi:Pyridoxamine 5'-phosphate oxidase
VVADSATRVDPATEAFLAEVMPAIVGTRRLSGAVKLTPVWFEYRAERFWLNGWRGARWLDQLLSQGCASLLFIDPNDMHRVVHVEAELASATTEGASLALDRLSQRYLGRNYRASVPRTRVIVELDPTQIRSTIG